MGPMKNNLSPRCYRQTLRELLRWGESLGEKQGDSDRFEIEIENS